jgi:hypothetical protein
LKVLGKVRVDLQGQEERRRVFQLLLKVSDILIGSDSNTNIPSIGVVIGSKKRRFCFKRRRLSCKPSEPTPPFPKALLRASFAKFSAVGKECTRQEESRVRAKDPKERIDTFMKKASRMKSAVMG